MCIFKALLLIGIGHTCKSFIRGTPRRMRRSILILDKPSIHRKCLVEVGKLTISCARVPLVDCRRIVRGSTLNSILRIYRCRNFKRIHSRNTVCDCHSGQPGRDKYKNRRRYRTCRLSWEPEPEGVLVLRSCRTRRRGLMVVV
jgi:hypothetical protein